MPKLENTYRTRPRRTHKWSKEELDKLCLMWIDMSPMTFHYTPVHLLVEDAAPSKNPPPKQKRHNGEIVSLFNTRKTLHDSSSQDIHGRNEMLI